MILTTRYNQELALEGYMHKNKKENAAIYNIRCNNVNSRIRPRKFTDTNFLPV